MNRQSDIRDSSDDNIVNTTHNNLHLHNHDVLLTISGKFISLGHNKTKYPFSDGPHDFLKQKVYQMITVLDHEKLFFRNLLFFK